MQTAIATFTPVRKPGRGRPPLTLNFPTVGTFTINDLVAANPQITCRLSVYTLRDKAVQKRVIRLTGKTVPTGTVGKPLAEYQSMVAFRRSKAAKKAAKTRKGAKSSLPNKVVDLTPAAQPVAA